MIGGPVSGNLHNSKGESHVIRSKKVGTTLEARQ